MITRLRDMKYGKATQRALMVGSAGQPGTQLITVFKTQVGCRQAMIIGDNILTPLIGVGQDITTGPGQLKVLSFLDTAIFAAVADHDFTIKCSSGERITQTRIAGTILSGLGHTCTAKRVSIILCMDDFSDTNTICETCA